jgi:3-deoxy-manno-octulosonate cytidylyltransferase (CMP-KDO synthetase)
MTRGSLRALVVIPARLGSTRLPGKALAPVAGKPMVAHVVARGLEAAIGPVAVATDSAEIAEAAEAAGARVVLTHGGHVCGSDRIAEALATLNPAAEYDIVVNLQGDQPFLPRGTLAAALALLGDPAVDIGTLAVPAAPGEEDDPNVPKMIGTEVGPRRLRALYFSRARAPFGEGPFLHHIGVYAYRRAALERFARLPPSALERRERLEQLRALEAGMRIDAALLDKAGPSVDTEQDLAAARRAAEDIKDES